MLAALYVLTDGPYFGLEGVDPWDKQRDARRYAGPHPVIAHPPCERWGRYWHGGPNARERRAKGDDDGCFEAALKAVRAYGGVLEHPEASHAFSHFKLPRPAWHGGWTEPDEFGGRSACVAQGHYGHPARKMTWLYAVGLRSYPELRWGPTEPRQRSDLGYRTAEERRRAVRQGAVGLLSHKQRMETPVEFRDLLIKMATHASV